MPVSLRLGHGGRGAYCSELLKYGTQHLTTVMTSKKKPVCTTGSGFFQT